MQYFYKCFCSYKCKKCYIQHTNTQKSEAAAKNGIKQKKNPKSEKKLQNPIADEMSEFRWKQNKIKNERKENEIKKKKKNE